MGEPAKQGVGPAVKGVESATISLPDFAALFVDAIKAEVGEVKKISMNV